MAIGVVQITPTSAATRPPAKVPAIRSEHPRVGQPEIRLHRHHDRYRQPMVVRSEPEHGEGERRQHRGGQPQRMPQRRRSPVQVRPQRLQQSLAQVGGCAVEPRPGRKFAGNRQRVGDPQQLDDPPARSTGDDAVSGNAATLAAMAAIDCSICAVLSWCCRLTTASANASSVGCSQRRVWRSATARRCGVARSQRVAPAAIECAKHLIGGLQPDHALARLSLGAAALPLEVRHGVARRLDRGAHRARLHAWHGGPRRLRQCRSVSSSARRLPGHRRQRAVHRRPPRGAPAA